MKRTLTLLALVVCAMTALCAEKPKRVLVETPHLSLVLDLFTDGQPRYTYFGPRLDRRDVDNIPTPSARTPLYPAYGQEVVHEAALAMTHADGSMATELRYTDTRIVGEPHAMVTIVRMQDKVYPTVVNICYRAYNDVDIIETWTEIENW